MNIQSILAATVAVATLSAPAFAGELYGSVERSAERIPGSLVFLKKLDLPLAVDGELHAEAQAAQERSVGSPAARPAFVTRLAVEGELGSPIPSNSTFATDEASTSYAE